MTNKTAGQSETVEIVGDTLLVAHKRAESLGLSLTEYVRSLISNDMQTEKKDPWREPVPQHVSERWEREIAEFDEEDKKGLQPTFNTVQELIDDLDS